MPTLVVRLENNRGRNGNDIPSALLEGQVAEAYNIDLVQGTYGRKRNGSDNVALSGTFSGILQFGYFIPGTDDTAAEIFFTSNDTPTKLCRVAAGTTISDLTRKDNVSARPQDVHFVTGNGKLWIAYKSAVNRIHVFDPDISTSIVRRGGLATPGAPSVANQGSGTYAATLRYYRVRWYVNTGGAVQRYGLFGTAQSFTPSGTGASARITMPTAPSEGETHWQVAASADGTNYYILNAAVVGTTTIDDTTAPSAYAQLSAVPEEGAYTCFPSCKFLAYDGDRLLGFGVHEATSNTGDGAVPYAGTLYYSPVLGTTSGVAYDDDERCSQSATVKGQLTIARNVGGEDRAIIQCFDKVLCFQSNQVTLCVRTGNTANPYVRSRVEPFGAVSQWSTFLGKDESGQACVYFLEPKIGPCRFGVNGFQWLGYDIQDVWATFNADATTRSAVGVYNEPTRRCEWRIATGSSNDATTPITFQVEFGVPTKEYGVRFGWTTGSIDGTPKCLAMLPATIGATMTRALKPYSGNTTAAPLIKHDVSTVTDGDDGTAYQAYITSRAIMGRRERDSVMIKVINQGKSWLEALAAFGVKIRQTLIPNYGGQADRTSDVVLSPDNNQTRVVKRFEDSALADAKVVQVKLGDAAAVANLWTIDAWEGHLTVTEKEAGS